MCGWISTSIVHVQARARVNTHNGPGQGERDDRRPCHCAQQLKTPPKVEGHSDTFDVDMHLAGPHVRFLFRKICVAKKLGVRRIGRC
jgi:hypothetical protein